jgi:hypothetical protein
MIALGTKIMVWLRWFMIIAGIVWTCLGIYAHMASAIVLGVGAAIYGIFFFGQSRNWRERKP